MTREPAAGVPARTSDGTSLAERMGARLYDLEVVGIADLTPAMRRINLHSDDLESLEYTPGQDLMLALSSAEGGRTTRRRYTIRSRDREQGTVALDIVLHGDGPGARWAAAVKIGDHVEGIAPRGKIWLQEGADWHLLIGDDAFVPAAMAMSEAATGVAVTTILEVEAEDPSVLAVEGPEITWVQPVAAGDSGPLLAALSEWERPPGEGYAYIGGELRMVAALRGMLLEKGMEADHTFPKPYWRAGLANADHGEPDRS